MSKLLNLILPTKIELQPYKGFIISVKPVDNSLTEFIGVAQNAEKTATFTALANSRNECGRQLENYVDIYRKSEKQQKIIVSTK